MGVLIPSRKTFVTLLGIFIPSVILIHVFGSSNTFFASISPSGAESLQSRCLSLHRSEAKLCPEDHPDCGLPRFRRTEKNTLQSRVYQETLHDFVLVLGHARSGSSIIGAVLDAHPHILLSHEYFLVPTMAKAPQPFQERSFLLSELYRNQLSRVAETGAQGLASELKGYALAINDSFQGRFDDWIGVIGDKSAAKTTWTYMASAERFVEIVHNIQDTSGVPVKFIQAVRNPFDNIATKALYAAGGPSLRAKLRKDSNASDTVVTEQELDCIIENHIAEVQALETFHASRQFPVHRVYNEQMVAHPKEVIVKLCEFLNMDCTQDYIDRCAATIFPSASQSRYLVKWNQRQISRVLHLISTIDSLRSMYSPEF